VFFLVRIDCEGLAGFEFIYLKSTFFLVLFHYFSLILRLKEIQSEILTKPTSIAGYRFFLLKNRMMITQQTTDNLKNENIMRIKQDIARFKQTLFLKYIA